MSACTTRKRLAFDRLASYSTNLNDQYARAEAMQQALRKAERQHPRENAPKLGQIQSLGLLGHDEESKAALGKQ